MKKLFAFAACMTLGVMISFAQTATTTTTAPVTEEKVEMSTPAVNAVDAQQSAVKCTTAPSGTKSCCSHNTSRTSAVTAPDASSTATTTDAAITTTANTVEATAAPNCHQVSVSVSAAKPEETTKPEDPKK